jgi:hypothetical protein
MKMMLFSCMIGLVWVQAGEALPIEMAAKPSSLVTDEAGFRRFAEKLFDQTELRLGEAEGVDDPETLKMLLSIRVHLANCLADDNKAAAAAAWIRSIQTDPAQRAYAGLTTFAIVEARRTHPSLTLNAPEMHGTVRKAFLSRLSELPSTPEILALLHQQRDTMAALDGDLLMQDLIQKADPLVAPDGRCTWPVADMVVRIIHRRLVLLPLKAELISALDHAIAARQGL